MKGINSVPNSSFYGSWCRILLKPPMAISYSKLHECRTKIFSLHVSQKAMKGRNRVQMSTDEFVVQKTLISTRLPMEIPQQQLSWKLNQNVQVFSTAIKGIPMSCFYSLQCRGRIELLGCPWKYLNSNPQASHTRRYRNFQVIKVRNRVPNSSFSYSSWCTCLKELLPMEISPTKLHESPIKLL